MNNKKSAFYMLIFACFVSELSLRAHAIDVNVPPLTLNDAIQTINTGSDTNNNINITGAATANSDLTGITKNVNITSGINANIDLQNHRGFQILNGSTVNSGDISVSNGQANYSGVGGGGAFNLGEAGTLNIKNMNFTDNTTSNAAVDSGGGAIYTGINTNLTVDNTTFSTNSSTTVGGGNGGGAIFNNGNALITNSTFNNNSAGMYGGAIFNNGANAVINSNNNIYNSNTAGTYGGAIYSTFGKVTSTGDNFTGNSAQTGGAIMHVGDGIGLQITDGNFTRNNANGTGSGASSGYGGAIYQSAHQGSMTIDNTTFSENSSALGGGAIFITQYTSGSTEGNSTATINNSNFLNNEGGGNSWQQGGGAILIEGGATVNIGNNNNFDGNTAANGGHIYNFGKGTLNIGDGNIFQNGKATDANQGWGGAIANTSVSGDLIANLNINGANQFLNNSAKDGGAIYQNYYGSTQVEGTASISGNNHFENNTATQNGGAIFSQGKLNMTNGTVSFNSNSAVNGGAIYKGWDTANIANATFENNLATADGGGIYVNNSASATLSNVKFDGNTARGNGGAVYNTGSYLTTGNVDYLNNTAAQNGGAIYTTRDTTVRNGLFKGNSAGADGGALYVEGNLNLDSSANNIVFTENTSQVGNNDIHNNNATININGSANTVAIGGGFSGTGNINKDGQGQLLLGTDSDSTAYTGNFNQTAGITTVQGTFFGGSSEVNGGTMNWLTDKEKSSSGSLNVNDGTLNVGDGNNNYVLVLNNSNDEIHGDAVVHLSENSEIKNDAGTITFNNDGDTWGGKVTNTSTVILDGFAQEDDAHGEHHQSGGTTILKNGARVTLGANTSITGGDIEVTTNSVLTAGTQSDFTGVDNFYINTNGLFNAGPNPFAVNNTMYIDNGTVNAISGNVTTNNIGTLNVGNGGGNFDIDINAYGAQSDRFVAGSITGAGNLNLNNFQIIGHAPEAQKILFTVFDSSNIGSDITFSTTHDKAVTPIYVYKLASEGGGVYSLTREAGDAGYNKDVYRGQVATLSMFNNQLLVNQALFDHVYLDSEELLANARYANQYASVSPLFAPYQYTKNEGGLWYKAYAAFDRFDMTRGLDVGNNAYGSIIGADFTPISLKRGWKFLPTPYIAYNGGHQTFNAVGMYQNGGQAGFMGTFLHRDFIASFLAFGGGYQNSMNVEGYTDRTGNWFAGGACKAAYNFRPVRNVIVQPNALISYMIFGNQNWGSNFGQISMNSGFLNGINLAPGVNVIYGRETWSVYGSVQYMYFINDKLDGVADGEKLASIRMQHGYIAYGVGVIKSWKERFLGYLQVTIFNGGINGVGFQGGVAYKI